jgi:lysophospholipase L1-like esterase
MIVHPNSKFVMIGDSITDCDRARPVGEGPSEGLGNGYVSLVDGLINATCPELRIRVVNMGISGNTVRDLNARWKGNVLDLQPDWLSIMIGINDVWRHFDTRLQTERQVPIDEYERTLDELIQATRPMLKGLVLMTPFFIEPDHVEPIRAMMDKYGDVVRSLAVRHEAVLVDTQAAFDEVMKELHPMALAADRVHPNVTGHMVLARAFLKAMSYAW